MPTITIWILLAVSNGSYNHGTTTVVARFIDRANCEAAAANMPTGPLKVFCVAAPGAF